MDFSRIQCVLDTDQLTTSHVVMVGTGAAKGLAENLVRCGVGTMTLIDPDCVGPENLTRQGFFVEQVGKPKALATAEDLERIRPECDLRYMSQDFTNLDDNQVQKLFADTDLFVFATDHFPCQARGNQVAMMLGVPAVFVGGSARGAAGEVVWTSPHLAPCYRCLTPTRYRAAEAGMHARPRSEPASSGVTAFDMALVDSIAGHIILGLLTQGADNRFGRLVSQLHDRQFLQVKLDPTWTLNGVDIIRQRLGVSEASSDFFSWNCIARKDPDAGHIPCPDCAEYRGTEFYYEAVQGRKVLGRKENSDSLPVGAIQFDFPNNCYLDETAIEDCVLEDASTMEPNPDPAGVTL